MIIKYHRNEIRDFKQFNNLDYWKFLIDLIT